MWWTDHKLLIMQDVWASESPSYRTDLHFQSFMSFPPDPHFFACTTNLPLEGVTNWICPLWKAVPNADRQWWVMMSDGWKCKAFLQLWQWVIASDGEKTKFFHHPWSSMVTGDHYKQCHYPITHYHSWSLSITRGHSVSLMVTHCHWKSLMITDDHLWSSVITGAH